MDSTGKKLPLYKNGSGIPSKAYVFYLFGSIALGIVLTGSLLCCIRLLQRKEIKLNDENFAEFQNDTKILGNHPYQEPYPRADV